MGGSPGPLGAGRLSLGGIYDGVRRSGTPETTAAPAGAGAAWVRP